MLGSSKAGLLPTLCPGKTVMQGWHAIMRDALCYDVSFIHSPSSPDGSSSSNELRAAIEPYSSWGWSQPVRPALHDTPITVG